MFKMPQKIVLNSTANENYLLGPKKLLINACKIGYPTITTQNMPFDRTNTDVLKTKVGTSEKEYFPGDVNNSVKLSGYTP